MHIFELVVPGTWLDIANAQSARQLQQQVEHIRSQFYEANAALNLFEASRAQTPLMLDPYRRRQDRERRSQIQRRLESERGAIFDRNLREQLDFDVDVLFKKEEWSHGRFPSELEHKNTFIYAKAFLYALDSIDKFLHVLAREADAPSTLIELCSEFSRLFPDLKEVRNTAHHLEDRARGLGLGKSRKLQPLDLQPVQNEFVHAPNGGVLMLNVLNGSKYGSTMADGHYGEVDISTNSMEALQSLIQAVLDAFPWRGPKEHTPRQ